VVPGVALGDGSETLGGWRAHQHPFQSVLQGAVISCRDRDAEAGVGNFLGEDVTLGEHHREAGPQVIEDSRPERVTGLDVVEVRAHRHVGIEQEIGSFPVRHPSGVEEHVLAREPEPP
jgi:hypothetical protein